jgi:aerobic-type carbon monoxide dehydrogenase small subunit (CoxS/CutS family)
VNSEETSKRQNVKTSKQRDGEAAKRDNVVDLAFVVNGESVRVEVPPFATLLDVLRGDLELTGTKYGCGEGECGACSVLLDGNLVNACLVVALECEGSEVTTIEGLAAQGKLHPIQQAFVDHGAIQCGFCTPGMIMAAYALLADDSSPTEDEVRRALEGNLCRCTGYRKIVDAVLSLVKHDSQSPIVNLQSPIARGGTRNG